MMLVFSRINKLVSLSKNFFDSSLEWITVTHQNSEIHNKFHRRISLIWLKILSLSILSMVIIGGFTRLSDSGLSIVEWKPITGVILPLNEDLWNEEFDKYKSSPEFQKINSGITLQEFKFIYKVEFYHRLIGRIIGIFFALSLIIFWKKNIISGRLKVKMLLVLAFGVAQAFMGWYMVKSGLKDSPYVSHFMLASHLIFASVIFSVIVWEISYLRREIYKFRKIQFSKIGILTLFLCFFQIWLGGLVAGLDAGLIYNSFPYMGEKIIPYEMTVISGFSNYMSDPASVQFFHRLFAFVLFFFAVIYSFILFQQKRKILSSHLLFLLIIQIAMGIVTLITSVSMHPALTHQILAFFILGILVYSQGNLKHKKMEDSY